MRRVLALCLGIGLLLPAGAAMAQLDSREAIQLNNQILELRRDVQQLRDAMQRGGGGGGSTLGTYRSGGPPPAGAGNDIVTALLDRVAGLEDQVRRLQGRADEADNARQRMGDDLRKEIEDLNFKLGAGGGGGAGGAVSPPPRPLGQQGAAAPPAAAAPPPRRTPELAMQEGNAALARRDYVTAEAAAREVLAMPRSPRSTDAQFLLAQALSGKKDHQAAAVAFDDTYNRAKTGSHAQDSLVGLANSLNAIGEKRVACVTLDKLRAEFPQLRADVRDAATAARQRAGCR